jgi:hypothetical protein
MGATIEETLTTLNTLFPNSKKIVMSGVEPLNFRDLQSTYKFDIFVCKDFILEKMEKTVLSFLE